MSQPQALGTRVRIEFAQASDPGRDPNKQVNEDSCGYAETRFGHLVVLCDGMGGHYGGREASRTAIATIFEVIDQAGATPAAALKAAIEEAGRRVYQLGGPPENRARPGSTVVAMLVGDHGLDVAHVGDSRAYCIRSGQIYPLTRDHSMVQGMIDAGMISEAEAIGHPDANKITRALGMRPEVEVEVRPEPMEMFPGDILLQSSDGLTDLVLAADILGSVRQSLASGALPQACNQLVNLANDRGGHDNITVQMVRIVDSAPRASNTIPQAPANAPEVGAPRPAPPQETRPMTVADASHNAPAATKLGLPPPAIQTTLPSAGSPVPTRPDQGALPLPPTSGAGANFQPVQPTAVDRPVAPSPTVPEPPPSHGFPQQAAYAQPPHPGAPSPRLQPFASQLPLPPPSGKNVPTQIQTTLVSGQGKGPAPTQAQMPAAPAAPSPSLSPPSAGSPSLGGARPSQAGMVYLIIGMSAVIAVLLLLLIWALFLRQT